MQLQRNVALRLLLNQITKWTKRSLSCQEILETIKKVHFSMGLSLLWPHEHKANYSGKYILYYYRKLLPSVYYWNRLHSQVWTFITFSLLKVMWKNNWWQHSFHPLATPFELYTCICFSWERAAPGLLTMLLQQLCNSPYITSCAFHHPCLAESTTLVKMVYMCEPWPGGQGTDLFPMSLKQWNHS